MNYLAAVEAVERKFMTKVYAWMALGLALTGIVAAGTARFAAPFVNLIADNLIIAVIAFLVIQFGLIRLIVGRMEDISAGLAKTLFVVYSIITGLNSSWFFMFFTNASIASTFIVTAGTLA